MEISPFEPFLDLKERPEIAREFNIEAGWRFALARRALFAELDALSHLNHTTFLRYFEDARIGYMMHHGLPAPGPRSLGCVLAHLEADYKQPVFFDQRLIITVRTVKIGNTSISLEYGAWSAEKGLTCRSTSLLVLVVTVSGEKQRVSDAMRASISAFEGREY
jgi:acyl-CoA thioester hydrolase